LVEQLERLAILCETREHAARLGPLLERRRIPHAARPRPARHHQSRDLLDTGGTERRAGRRDALALEPVARLAAGRRLHVLALDPDRAPLAARAARERLRVGAHDRGHAHRPAPVAAVPLDAVARRHVPFRRTLVRLDAVHEEEPVDLAAGPLAREPVDGLNEATAEAGRHVELRAQHAHHGVALVDLVEAHRAELLVAEVARDSQRGAAALTGAPLPEATARRRRREGRDEQGCGEGADTPHGTSTSSVNERTRPSLRATSR